MTLTTYGAPVMAKQDVWMTTHQEYYKVFRIDGCTPAAILLTTRTMALSSNTYLVTISNTETKIEEVTLFLFLYSVKFISTLYFNIGHCTIKIKVIL